MPQIPPDLIEALQERRVVPFVGAGLSITVDPTRFLSWGGLIEKLETLLRRGTDDDCRTADEVEALRQTGALVAAAEKLAEGLGARGLEDAIRDVSGGGRGGANLTAVQALWRMRPTLVITTNYDQSLLYPFDHNPDNYPLHNDEPARFASIEADRIAERRIVWHVHGSVLGPESIVLTPSQYERFYEQEGVTRLTKAYEKLKQVLTESTLLFIGSGVEDRIVERILEEMTLTRGHRTPGYVIAKQGQQELEQLRSLNLKRIEYSDHGPPFFELMHQIAVEAWGEPELLAANAPQLDAPRTEAVDELLQIIRGRYVDPERIQACFAAANGRAEPSQHEGDAFSILPEAIYRLGGRNPDEHGRPRLPSFIETLLPDVSHDLKADLEHWVAGARDTFGPAASAPIAVAPPPTDPYVLVSVGEPRGAGRPIHAWLFGDGPPEPLFEGERVYTRSDFSTLMKDLIFQVESRRIDPSSVDLAFMVPRALLPEALEHERPDAEGPYPESKIGATCRFMLRVARSRRGRGGLKWQSAWETWKASADDPLTLRKFGDAEPPGGWAAWVDRVGPGSWTIDELRGADLTMVALPLAPSDGTGPRPDLIDAVLQVGLPVAAWARPPLSEDPARAEQELRAFIEQNKPGRLAESLREKRCEAGDEEDPAASISLLVDDLDRIPPHTDPANRLVYEHENR